MAITVRQRGTTMSAEVEVDAPYVMGRTPAEYERLRRQARQLEPLTAALLDRVGVNPGAHCLDVGCGPGEVMRLMAELAGPRGSVTGIDVDGDLGRKGLAALHAAGHAQCAFVEGDVLTMLRPQDGPFDLVYARLVLIHADQPLALLRRMWDWTARDGVLVVQDYDLRSVATDPPLPLVDEFHRVFLGVFERAGRPLDAGTRLRRQFAAAGLGVPDDVIVDGTIEPMAQARRTIEGAYRSVLPLALEWGLTSPAESDGWLTELAAAPADATVLHPLMISAVRRKAPVRLV